MQADLDKTLLNNWERGKRDQSDYAPLKDERIFVSRFKEQLNVVEMQGYTRLFDSAFIPSSVRPGDDQRLYDKQKAYATVVLTKLLKTTQGLQFLSVHKGDPRQQLLLYQAHILKSTNAGTIISQANTALYNYPISKHRTFQDDGAIWAQYRFENQDRHCSIPVYQSTKPPSNP